MRRTEGMTIEQHIRYNQLKAMHEVIRQTNDGNIYFSWSAIGIADGPIEVMEEDFRDIAADEKQYNEIVDLFIKLISKPGYRV